MGEVSQNTLMTSIENRPAVSVPKEYLPSWMAAERTRLLTEPSTTPNSDTEDTGCVVYWMQRDVRVADNWALCFAAHLAQSRNLPLRVVYTLPPPPPPPPAINAEDIPDLQNLPLTERYGQFLLGGLECCYDKLKALQVPLHVLQPFSHSLVGEVVRQTAQQCEARVVVSDFSPLRHVREWMEVQAAPLLQDYGIPMWQVDAHNVVPVWTIPQRQVGARTLRPKIHKVLSDFLTDTFPKAKSLLSHQAQALAKQSNPALPSWNRSEYESYLQLDKSVPTVSWAVPGKKAGLKQFETFCTTGLAKYDQLRNDPTQTNICSNMSPWLNHGHVSFQRLAILVKKLNKHANGTASFVEEGLVRRELSDNYLYYTPNDYDKLTGAAGWAKETLQVHASDPREYVYTLQELETGCTHDDLWNAAQLQVVQEGGMHGFLRMYWAKKILEWTPSPLVALQTAQYFNDKYALDGRDPNGFVGVGWSIMGIHDQVRLYKIW